MPNHVTHNFDNLLLQVAEKTFGELAFLLIEQEEITQAKHQSPPRWGYAVRAEFSGPFGGEMYLAITDTMLLPLATNMLGIDENEAIPEGVQPEDALKELLNVTCGNLLPRIGGDRAVFHISAPTLLPTPTPPFLADHEPIGPIQITLDIGTAYLAMFLDPKTPCELVIQGDSMEKGDTV